MATIRTESIVGRLAAAKARAAIRPRAGRLAALGLAGGVLAGSVVGAGEARAGVYDLSYTTAALSVTLQLTTSNTPDPNVSGGYDILSVSGTRNGQAVSLVPPSGPTTGATFIVNGSPVIIEYNNILYPSAPFFDTDGLLISTAGGDFNIYYEGSTYYEMTPVQKANGSLGTVITAISVSPASVPEPSTLSLLLAGFSVVALCTARRKMPG